MVLFRNEGGSTIWSKDWLRGDGVVPTGKSFVGNEGTREHLRLKRSGACSSHRSAPVSARECSPVKDFKFLEKEAKQGNQKFKEKEDLHKNRKRILDKKTDK